MAIDPKELRIGSHVNANGVRAKVIDIHNKTLSPDCKYQIFMEGISPEDGEKKVVRSYADGLAPILITPELLTELGFEWNGTSYSKEYAKDSYVVIFPSVTIESFRVILQPKDSRRHMDFLCEYLHELESLYYHCTKQELINN